MYLKGKNAVFQLMVLSQLDEFVSFLNEVDSTLSSKAVAYINNAEKYAEDEQEEYWDFYGEDYHDYTEVYPSFLNNSMFISIYSYLEYHLLKQCDKEILRSIKGNGIEKGKKYLKKHHNILEPFNSREWNIINDCNKIRNCLAHNGGSVGNISDENKQHEVIKIVKKHPSIKLSSRGQIVIEKDFCIEFCYVVKRFLTLVAKERKVID